MQHFLFPVVGGPKKREVGGEWEWEGEGDMLNGPAVLHLALILLIQ